MRLLYAFLWISVFLSPTYGAIQAILLNNITVPNPAYTSILRVEPSNLNSWTLFISSFSPYPNVSDNVYKVTDIQTKLISQISTEQITNKIVWPNHVIQANALNSSLLLVPSGFVLPGKDNGNMYLVLGTNEIRPLVPIDENMTWFYHDAAFKDMDKDGFIDIVTSRANVPRPGRPTSQLIWLKNPGGNLATTSPWEVHHITIANDGPDVDLQFEEVDSIQVLFANGYFSRKLQMLWSNSSDLWNDNSYLNIRDIDSQSRAFFTIRLTMDLNGDQRPDLLVTENDMNNGTLVAYELPLPGEILTGVFKKHILASGFKPFDPETIGGAPGHAVAVKLSSPNDRKKPVIVLSGDDDGCLYLLEAVHDIDISNWEYTLTKLYDSGGSIVGQSSVEDVDNDGYPEIFVPVYDFNTILVYRLVSGANHSNLYLFSSSLLSAWIVLFQLLNAALYH